MTTGQQKRPSVFLERLDEGYEPMIRCGLELFRERGAGFRSNDRIAIKPNLTFPSFRKGVMTNPEAVEALIRILKDYTDHITICESDSGGYNRFSMDEVFEVTGIKRIAERYGVRIVNLSHEPSRSIPVRSGMRALAVPLPVLLLDEIDVLITMPVPKIHMNTGVSLSLKNQWGTIQDPRRRLQLHPYFTEVIYAINKSMKRTISIIDGKFGLTRSGPMKGDVVELNWLLMSDNVFAADLVATHLMGIDVADVPHLRYAMKQEGLDNVDQVEISAKLERFRTERPFYLERVWTDYPGFLAFHSRVLAYLGYESPLAGILHRLLYLFREPFYDYDAHEDRHR